MLPVAFAKQFTFPDVMDDVNAAAGCEIAIPVAVVEHPLLSVIVTE